MSPKPTILALNSGSSSLKFGLFDAGTCEGLLAGEIDWAGGDRARAQFTLRPRNGSSVTSRLAVRDDFPAAKLAVKLEAVPKSGKVRVQVSQPSAVVRIDGNEIAPPDSSLRQLLTNQRIGTRRIDVHSRFQPGGVEQR